MNVAFLEKVASDLEAAADYIESYETKISEEQAEVNAQKEAEENKKRAEVMAPLKETLATIGEDDSEIEEKLKSASIEALELIGKTIKSQKEAAVQEDWGSAEPTNKKGGTGKYAGYKDPIEAFAMS